MSEPPVERLRTAAEVLGQRAAVNGRPAEPPRPRIGSLFTGYSGLDMAVTATLGGAVAWHCEHEPPTETNPRPSQAAAKVLAHHHPDVPNLGDITQVNWADVEPVDVLAGGFPCQDVSSAGRRLGMRPGNRSGLWQHMAYAIDRLRPELVVIENVRGLLSADAHCDVEPCPWCLGDDEGRPLRALGAVLGDLVQLGYDARWGGLRAADVGAPHGRYRIFITAWPAAGDAALFGRSDGEPADRRAERERPTRGPGVSVDPDPAGVGCWPDAPADTASDGRGEGRAEPARLVGRPDAALGSDVAATDPDSVGSVRGRPARGRRSGPANHDLAAADAVHDRRQGRTEHDSETEVAWQLDARGDAAGRVLDTSPDGGVTQPSASCTGILGRRELHHPGLPNQATCPGHVQEALHPLEDDGRPVEGQGGRAEAEARSRAVLDEGPEDRDMLAVDRRLGESLGPRKVHGRRAQERQGAPLGVRGDRWADPGRADTGSPLSEPSLREPSAHGAGHVGGEPAPAGGGEDTLPAGAPPVGGQPLPRPEDGIPPLPSVPGTARPEQEGASAIDWGAYAPAIARWELILGRPAPAPTMIGARGGQQLSPTFVEFMMGLPAGWVTAVPGISRNEQLKMLGNGVVPQQAAAALRWLLAASARGVAA